MKTIQIAREYQTDTNGSVYLLFCPEDHTFRTGWKPPCFGFEDESEYSFDDTVSEDQAILNWSECLMRAGNSGYCRRTAEEAQVMATADVAKVEALFE